ncbi:hypothetical protein [Clostridium guangxiense]|uniref:hypothetical protein n=1 Tax=Clostridium guangxiense TaxID=1662055 RepID=UPI001E58DCB9|nr:hypothetical protein [Clostridium guangxiense]MCD2346160.1 hypothetical protein [Clostridium guangxiense]
MLCHVKKFDRDFRENFYGIEACLFKDEKDIWRFADESEYMYEQDYPIDKFKKYSKNLFCWLSEKSLEYNFIPVLEFDGLNKYVCEENFLESLLEKYKAVRLCLDTGRLHLQNKIDSDFDEKEIIRKFARYTEVVHLWNVKISGNLENNHFPALPSLKVEDGWAPILLGCFYIGGVKNVSR